MYKLVPLSLVVLTFGAIPSRSWTQSDGKKPGEPFSLEEQKAEMAKLREVFASVDKLPAKGARWVEVQAGSAEQKSWHKGWLLRDSKDEMELLTADGWKQKFDKKKLAAKKPAADFTWSDVWAVRNGD